MRGVVNGTLAQLSGLLHRHIILVRAVQYPVGVGGARTNAEDVVGEAGTVCVNIVEAWPLREEIDRGQGSHASLHLLLISYQGN